MRVGKRGNSYLRKLLIQGARAALPYVAERDTSLARWAQGLLASVHPNVAGVALANKPARIWRAVPRSRRNFSAKDALMGRSYGPQRD